MTAEQDNIDVGALVTILLAGTLLTLTAVFAMQGLTLQGETWEFERKELAAKPAKLIHLRSTQLGELQEYRVVDQAQQRYAVPIDLAKEIVANELNRGR